MTESEKGRIQIYDVVIIGAGLYGIQAARYYLDIHPNATLCILESDDVVGGTWSSKRIYEAFWTQTPVGMAEFSDRPMAPPPDENQYYGFFPARYVTEYLESYIDNHVYNETTIRDRIMFSTRVHDLKKTEDGLWTAFCQGGKQIKAAKVTDAEGMTSIPNWRHFDGEQDFQGVIMHHKDFGQSTFLDDPKKQHVAILGGAKSAADVAYAAAKAGKTVSWIIRENGAGPAALLSAEGRGPYANSNESFYTRIVASFLPNPFGKQSYLERFLHRTWIGRWLVKRMWHRVDKENRRKVNYHRAEGKGMGFEKLEPETSVFWQNDSSGINQRPDFYSTIATKVHVYRQTINHFTAGSVVLSESKSGRRTHTLPVDVFVMCTGWSPNSSQFDPWTGFDLGLPALSPTQSRHGKAVWQALEDIGDRNVLARFPLLRDPPQYQKVELSVSPFRLYKAMTPIADIQDHSIVFLGRMVVGSNFRVAEVQALWAVAYLEGKLKLERQSMELEIGETVAWCRRRYLNKGDLGSCFFFDVIPYTDMLLDQLGLRSHRRKGWLKDFFGPCRAADLKDLVEEYKKIYPT